MTLDTKIRFPKLKLPQFKPKLKRVDKDVFVFDILRKKYIKLLPEEFVRQNLIHFFIDYLNYPKGLIGVEYLVKINNIPFRADLVVFDKKNNPLIIVEVKAPKINLTEDVLHQALRYNMKLNVPFIIISNGLKHMVFSSLNGDVKQLESFPNLKDFY